MKNTMTKIDGWQDFLEMLVALWLVSSPFVLGFVFDNMATITALLGGCLVLLFSMMGLSTHEPKDEWLSLIVGIVVIASPWLAGYHAIAVATMNAVICGSLLVALTIITMLDEYRTINREKAEADSHHHPV